MHRIVSWGFPEDVCNQILYCPVLGMERHSPVGWGWGSGFYLTSCAFGGHGLTGDGWVCDSKCHIPVELPGLRREILIPHASPRPPPYKGPAPWLQRGTPFLLFLVLSPHFSYLFLYLLLPENRSHFEPNTFKRTSPTLVPFFSFKKESSHYKDSKCSLQKMWWHF